MRDLHLFALSNDPSATTYQVSAIHDDHGYRYLRQTLAQQIAESTRPPDIQIVSVDRWGDRHLRLRQMDNQPLAQDEAQRTLSFVHSLWGYDVHLDMEDLSLREPFTS